MRGCLCFSQGWGGEVSPATRWCNCTEESPHKADLSTCNLFSSSETTESPLCILLFQQVCVWWLDVVVLDTFVRVEAARFSLTVSFVKPSTQKKPNTTLFPRCRILP